MIHLTIEDSEADYLFRLVRSRPIEEALDLFLKLAKQAQDSKNGAPLAGPQTALNGSAAADPSPTH